MLIYSDITQSSCFGIVFNFGIDTLNLKRDHKIIYIYYLIIIPFVNTFLCIKTFVCPNFTHLLPAKIAFFLKCRYNLLNYTRQKRRVL